MKKQFLLALLVAPEPGMIALLALMGLAFLRWK
ncbi:PEP-CTERM sorting domain-containing protein [bacterium]|nr:PEP-CTERM sorting domain-containing protein [bacterium]